MRELALKLGCLPGVTIHPGSPRVAPLVEGSLAGEPADPPRPFVRSPIDAEVAT